MSGSLWQPKATAAPKGLWKEPLTPKVAPTAAPIMLWTAALAPPEATAVPVRSAAPKHIVDEPLPIVSGEMWHKAALGEPDGLWKHPVETVVICRKASSAPLWTKEGAARTTAAVPSRAPFVPKPASSRPLEPATGKLWHLELPKKEPISLWKKNKPQPAALGVWNEEGTTPSLAEIKLRNEAKRDLLWQRRSVLAAKGSASEGVLSDRSSFIQKKPRKGPIFLETAQGELWKPAEGSIDDDDTSWMITNTPPTDPLSRTSTFSDISDLTPPTSAEDELENHIRQRFSGSGISPTGRLWQPPLDGSSSRKELGLWPTSTVSGSAVSLVGEDRLERVNLPRQREKPVEVFDSSHSLWQPEISCNSRRVRSGSDASEYCTGDSISEFSDDSFYSAMGTPNENPTEEGARSRGGNYVTYGQAPGKNPREDSPFAAHLKAPSLLRRPRSIDNMNEGNKGQGNGQGVTEPEKVAAPSPGWLWNKGIL